MQQYKILTNISIILFLLLTFIPVLSFADEKVLKIDPSDVVGLSNMRSEVTTMLEDIGYKWIPIFDESIQQKIKVTEKYGQYRMLFQAVDNENIQINMHLRQKDNVTGLHFTEIGTEQMSDVAIEYYQKLKQKVIQEYGADSVSDSYSFFTP